MNFDLNGAKKAGYSDAEIADHLAASANFDVVGARKAGYSDSEILGHLIPPPPTVADFVKSGVSGAASGLGMIPQGAGELLARGANAVAGAFGFDPQLRSENPLKGAIDWLEQSKSEGAKRAVADTQIGGSLFDPGTWDFGKNPTLSGLALQGVNAIGQFAPNLAIALATGGASVPAQLAIGATVGGLQALGGGAEEERHKVGAMKHDELLAGSTLYRTLIDRGVKEDVARDAVADAAALGGGLGNAIPSAGEGAFENFLVAALTKGKIKIAGKGLIGKAAVGGGAGAALGGTEEAIEQIGQNIGSNLAIGGNRPLTADTLQQFIMGAIAEGAAGTGAGAMQHVFDPRGAQPPKPDPEQETARIVNEIAAAPTVEGAVAAANDGIKDQAFMSDVNESIAGRLIGSRMEGIGESAARAAIETPAFEAIQAAKAREEALLRRDALSQQADQATTESLRQEESEAALAARQAREAELRGNNVPPTGIIAGAIPGGLETLRRVGESQADHRRRLEALTLARMEALRGAEPAAGAKAQGSAAQPVAAPVEPAPAQSAIPAAPTGQQEPGAAPVSAATVATLDQPTVSAQTVQPAPEAVGGAAAPAVATAAPIDAAAHQAATSPQNALPEPTPAQKDAGNYPKGHASVAGLDVSIENPAGSKRRPEWPTLKSHYGYAKGSVGMDKDHLDLFVKPGTPPDWKGNVYVVNQNREDGKPDESKAMLGFDSLDAARAAYLENYTAGWEKNVHSVTRIPAANFRAWALDKSESGPKGGFLRNGSPAVRIMGKPVHSFTTKALKAIEAPLAKKDRITPKQREQLSAVSEELDRRAEEVAARPLSDAEKARRENLARAARDRKKVNPQSDSIIPAIIKLGGLKTTERPDIIRDDTGNVGIPGVGHLFTKNGMEADGMAIELQQYGYLSEAEMSDVDGGVGALHEKVAEEFDGQRKHWSSESDAAMQEYAAQQQEEAEAQAAQADAVADDLGVEIDLSLDPAELVDEAIPSDAVALVRAEMGARAEALEEGVLERLAMQHDTDDAYWQAVAQFLKEREDAATVRNDAQADGVRQEEGEGSGVPEGDRAPSPAASEGREPRAGGEVDADTRATAKDSPPDGAVSMPENAGRKGVAVADADRAPQEGEAKPAEVTPTGLTPAVTHDIQPGPIPAELLQRLLGDASGLPRDGIVLAEFRRQMYVDTPPQLVFDAAVSNGDGTAVLAGPFFREPPTEQQVLAEANKRREQDRKSAEKREEGKRERLARIEELGLREGVTWADAEAYVEGVGKPGRRKFSKATITKIDERGIVHVTAILPGSRAPYGFKTGPDSRLFDNYPSRPALNLEQQTEADLDAKDARAADEKAAERAIADRERDLFRLQPREAPDAAPKDTTGDMFGGAGIAQQPAKRASVPADAGGGLFAKPQATQFGASNTVFTKSAADAARELLKKKLGGGTLNAGIDPEIMQAGIQLAGFYIEGGARTFADCSAKMIADLGDAVRPYLKSWYAAVYYNPGVDTEGMQEPGSIKDEEAPKKAPTAADPQEAPANPMAAAADALIQAAQAMKAAVTPKPEAPEVPHVKRGDRFTDGEGKTWEIWSTRSDHIEAFPVIDGKMRVSNSTSEFWALTPAAQARYPDARTDLNLIPAKKAGPTPQVASPGQLKTFIGIAADSIRDLRKVDVERVLTSNPIIYQPSIANHIREKRPDLAQEVDDVLAEQEPIAPQAEKETAPKEPDAAAQSQAAYDAKDSPLDQTQTEAFKRWSNNAPLITSADADSHQFKTGEKIVVEAFHGTKRPDRVGTKFQKKRATSGPMAFHTSDPALASSYATGKRDTSLDYEDQNYESWFKYRRQGMRSAVDLDRAWYHLTAEQKAELREKLPHVTDQTVDGDESDTLRLGVGDNDYGVASKEHWEYEIQQARGNVLQAAKEVWLSSGKLFGAEEDFMGVLRTAGFPVKDLTYDSPHAEYPFVYKNYISMQNPLVTNDIPRNVTAALDAAAKRDRSRARPGGDTWAKENRTLREWMEEFRKPENQYVWTSIPDKVTEVLRSLGYDGVVDWSGKSGGNLGVHPVYVPFNETQVKSAIGNKGTFSPDKRDILQQKQTAYNPAQLDLIYDDAETRPDTKPEQRADGIAALRALFGRDRRAGSTLLGSNLWRDFQERKGADLIGQQVGSAQELGLLAQILRDPRFETLRFFFVKDGAIVGHSGVTSRLPGSVAFSARQPGPSTEASMQAEFDGRIDELRAMMQNLGADGYYMLHNHPSGSSQPSYADEAITKNVAKSMDGFKGHIIINSETFDVISGRGDVNSFPVTNEPKQPELAHDALGMKISKPSDVMEAAKLIQRRGGYAALIAATSQGNVQAIAEVPEHLLSGATERDRMKAMVRVRRFAKMTGSGMGVFVVSENMDAKAFLIENGIVTDVLQPGKRASLASTVRAKRNRDYKSAALRAEQMQWGRGRPKTTGRYETREELVREVWAWYDMPGTTQAQIARITNVSETTVAKILNNGRPAELDAPPAFSRSKPTAFATTPDGRPLLSSDRIEITDPAYWQTAFGQRFFQSKIVAGGQHVGSIMLGWKDGKVASLMHIDVAEEHQGNGHGEAAVKSILQHNGDADLHVMHILPEARGFWLKIGTDPFQTETGEDGILTEASYLSARGNRADPQADVESAAGQDAEPGNAGESQAFERSPEDGGQALSGFPEAEVSRLVGAIRKAWANAPRIEVVGSMQDPRVPEAIRRADAEQREGGAKGDPEGFIHRGTVYLVASALKSPYAVYRTLFHEALGHYGLRGAFGADLGRVLADVVKAMPGRIDSKGIEYGLVEVDEQKKPLRDARGRLVWKPNGQMVAAEEVLAQLAQDRPDAGLVRRAVAAIRQFLRDLGIDLKLSDNDLIVNFILPARAFVEGRGAGATAGSPVPAFGRDAGDIAASREPSPWYSDLSRAIEKVGINAAPAKGWKDYIKGLAAKGVKADEIEWSGINDWLDLQGAKVTKGQVLDFLAENGVKVTEKMLGDGVREDATSEIDSLVVELDAKGYTVVAEPDNFGGDTVMAIERRSDGQEFDVTSDGSYSNEDALGVDDLPEDVRAIVVRLQAAEGRDFNSRTSADTGGTRYSQYTLPGGQNYRELLLTLPGPKVFESSHYPGVDNPLAHVRLNERTDADGKRVLFIEEIQSDWAQKGKKEGFTGPQEGRLPPGFEVRQPTAEETELFGIKPGHWGLFDPQGEMVVVASTQTMTREQAVRAAIASATEAGVDLGRFGGSNNRGVPAAPFVGKTEAWVALAMRRMIRYAAEHGFDRVAWTTGAQQAARYDLSRQVKQIKAGRMDGGWALEMKTTEGRELYHTVHEDGKLADFVGKDLADKIIAEAKTREFKDGDGQRVKLEGVQLKVGGEGMIAFYDRIVPNVANDVLKKLGGGRVGAIGIDMADLSVRRQGNGSWGIYDEAAGRYISTEYASENAATEAMAARDTVTQQPGFDLTDALRERALGGMPMFSRAAGNAASWDSPMPSRMDSIIYAMQDKQIDTRRVLEQIRKHGSVADAQDVRLQEELYHGRTAKQVDDFLAQELKPLVTEMAARKVTMAEFEEYLHARHAEERNAQIAKINPEMPDGGSGMDTADARAYLSGLDPAKKRAYEALAKRVDAINAKTRQALVDYGLESQDTVDAWEQAYQHYVPLQREDMEGGPGTGQGFSVRGPASKRATGSSRSVVDILANIAAQREKAIVRGEKNRVAVALVGLAESNPNADFWRVDDPPRIKYVDDRTGLVTSAIDPLYKSRENVVMARVPAAGGEIVERSVIFNEHDERAMRMAAALKNLDMDDLGVVLGMSAKVTRYFAAVNTQYNPVFGVVNLMRDFQGAMVNLSSTELAGKQAEVSKNTLSALRGIYIDTRDTRQGKPATSAWAQLWEEFQTVGGKTGYRDMFRTSKDRGEAIEREIARVSEGKAKQFGRAVFDWLSDYNTAMENAVRLSAYKAGLDSGMTQERAASLAKNLTVNFNRKGQVATQAGALYAFFNASVQGTARLAETLAGPAGRKIIGAGMTLGVLQALLLAAAGFDDNEPPEFVRERNLIIPIGDKKYITIPMPLGLHVLPNVTRIASEFALSGFRDPGKRVAQLAGVFAEAFNPVGNAGLSLQTIAPTAIDPLAALAENRDWTGKPIAREDMNKLAPTPGHTRAKDVASAFSKAVSKGLNWMTGGTNYKPGFFSPTPDQIDYLIGQATGGVGREAMKAEQTITSAFTGDDLPTHKVPLLGRLYGNAEQQSSHANAFYANLKLLNEHEAEIKGRKKAGEPIGDYMQENPEARLFQVGNQYERRVSELRRMKRKLAERDAPADQIKAIDERIRAQMKALNDRVKQVREMRP